MKVLICDDDISTVTVLKNQIPWEKMGVDQIFLAYHGKAAIEICLKEKPELVICDVEMPYANGIEVLRQIHDHRIFCAFAFLTAHESFQYAQEAIRLGAFNYITKPFVMTDVIADITEMIDYVNNRIERNKKTSAELKEKTEKGVTDEINSIFRSIRDGFWGNDKEKIQLAVEHRKLPIITDISYYTVTVIGDVGGKEAEGWNMLTLRYGFRYLAQEAIASRLDWRYMIFDPDSQYEILQIFLPTENLSLEELKKRCSSFIRVSNQNMQILPVCYIGGPVPFEELSIASEWKLQAQKDRLRYGQIIQAGEIEDERGVASYDNEKMLELIKSEDKSKFMSEIGIMTTQMAMGENGSDRMIAELHHDILQTFYQCLTDNGILAHDLFGDTVMRELDRNAERSVFDLISFSSHLFDVTISKMSAKDDVSIIAQVKHFIEQHYKQDINRDEISQSVFVTPNYLSKRFREETGVSLREYINRLRIDEAKRLLLTTDKPISTIALDMGFGNISYFSTVFKKITGMSPAEYRNRTEEQV